MKFRSSLKRLIAAFHRDKRDADLAAELESHLQFHIDDNLRAGMTPEEARRQALIKLGGLDQTKESVRDRGGLPWLDSLLQDTRFALRMLRKNPGFAAVAILTLALGIGANTAIFSVIEVVVLRPLPYRDPGKLVMLWERNVGRDSGNKEASGPDLIDWRQQNHVFEDMAFWPGWSGSEDFNLVGADGIEKVTGSYVSSQLFPVLGMRPLLGRAFLPEEDQRQGNRVALLSYELWQRRFASDPNALGRTITVDSYGRKDYIIVGVMPAGFRFPDRSELWLPAGWIDVQLDQRRSGHWYSVVARLRPGVTLDRAASEMNLIQAHIAQAHTSEVVGSQVAVVPSLDQTLGTTLRPALFALWGAVAFVLLIASANLSSLLLARNSARQKELTLRMVIGASLGRIVRQLLTESALLALTGGAIGIFAAYETVRLFVVFAANYIPRLADATVDAGSLAFTLGVSLITGLISGMGPASRLSHPDLDKSLRSVGPGNGTLFRGNRLRSWLVVGEIAASLVLLAGAGLMIRSFVAIVRIDRGFRPDHLLTAHLDFSVSGFTSWIEPTPTRPQVTLQRLIQHLRQYPGVDSVAAASRLPRDLGNAPIYPFVIEDRPPSPDSRPAADFEGVTPDYFKAMGVRLLQGRTFSEDDNLEAPLVVIVNSALAQRYFPNENLVGKRMAFASRNDPDQPNTFRGRTQWMQIVGVVSNVRSLSVSAQTVTEFYEPYWQYPMQSPTLLIRTAVDPATLTSAVRAEAKSVNPNLPVATFHTMDDILGESVAVPRYETVLFGLFGFFAVVLASVGIYGVVSYSVSRRTHEIGIRMALGARQDDILRMVLSQGMKLAAIGISIGIALAFALTPLIRTLLFNVSPTDPFTFVGVAMLLIAVALVACYIPARRATRVDPVAAMRCE